MRRLVWFLAVVISLLMCMPSWAKSDNLYDFVRDRHEVNVKIDEIGVAENVKEINSQKFSDVLKKVLNNRKSVNFNIVENPQEADLVISGNIKGFFYTEDDPIDILIPIGLVVDLMLKNEYARLEFDISISDPTKNRIVWKNNHLIATLNERGMSRENSIPLIIKRAAKVIIRDVFSKPR